MGFDLHSLVKMMETAAPVSAVLLLFGYFAPALPKAVRVALWWLFVLPWIAVGALWLGSLAVSSLQTQMDTALPLISAYLMLTIGAFLYIGVVAITAGFASPPFRGLLSPTNPVQLAVTGLMDWLANPSGKEAEAQATADA